MRQYVFVYLEKVLIHWKSITIQINFIFAFNKPRKTHDNTSCQKCA